MRGLSTGAPPLHPPAQLAPLSRADPAEIEALLDAAFGPERHARTAYRLREGVAAIDSLSFGAFEGGGLVGSIQCWPIELVKPGGTTPLTLVGPVAVAPVRQSLGIGRRLVEAALVAADASPLEGAATQAMIGDPAYYGRFFGFAAAGTAGWVLPGPVERHRLLVRGEPVPSVGVLRARLL